MRLDAKKTMIVTLPNATEKKSLFNEMAKLVDSLMQNGGSLKVDVRLLYDVYLI